MSKYSEGMYIMLGKIQLLVEAFPEYRHCIYIEDIEIKEKLQSLGYVVDSEISRSYLCYYIKVQKNKWFIDIIQYGYGVLSAQITTLTLSVDYNNNILTHIRMNSMKMAGINIYDAFLGYNESCDTLPEIWDKIVTILYGNIPVSVKYSYHNETTVDISR